MWRRLVSSHLKSLTALSSPALSTSKLTKFTTANPTFASCSSFLLACHFSTESGATAERKNIENVMPIATGTEREELLAEFEGARYLDINYPEGPFGTKEAPAVVKSIFEKRIVGCPGGEGEDEHDVVWFWLEKGKPHECPICAQYFELAMKWWDLVEILLNTGMRSIINIDCSLLFSLWNKFCKMMKRHGLANAEAFQNTEASLFCFCNVLR